MTDTTTQDMTNGIMCPLLTAAEPQGRLVGCYGEDCGFWNGEMRMCGIAAMSRAASYWILNDSRDRMNPLDRRLLHHRPPTRIQSEEAANAHR